MTTQSPPPDVDAIEATCFPGPLRFEVDTKNSHGEPQVLNSCIDDEGVNFLFVGNEDSDRPTEAEARATPEYAAGQRIVKLVNAAPALCAHVRRLTADNERATEAEANAAAMRKALEDWLGEHGVPHVGRMAGPHEHSATDWVECPEDDTCDCELPAQVNAALAPTAGRAILDELEAAREAIDELRPLADGGFSGMTARQKIAAYDKARGR